MFTFENRVGRFCELRVSGQFTASELASFKLQAATLMFKVPSKVVFCTDLRGMEPLPGPVFDSLVAMLRTDNPKIERNAMLVRPDPVTHMQMERLVQEGGHPGRRVFRRAQDLTAWVQGVLAPQEQKRLDEFIAEGMR